MTPSAWTDSPMMNMDYGYGSGAGLNLNGYNSAMQLGSIGTGGLTVGSGMISSDDFNNLFSSPRATPYTAPRRTASDEHDANANSMHLHYNHHYQPNHVQQGEEHQQDDIHDRYYNTGKCVDLFGVIYFNFLF